MTQAKSHPLVGARYRTLQLNGNRQCLLPNWADLTVAPSGFGQRSSNASISQDDFPLAWKEKLGRTLALKMNCSTDNDVM